MRVCSSFISMDKRIELKIGCIIVLYHPNDSLLKEVLDSAIKQVGHIVLVDNSPTKLDGSIYESNPRVVYRKMAENVGIAAAQNVGIKYFLENNYDFVMYLDQDSIMDAHLVDYLLDDFKNLKKQGVLIGAIGPRPFNRASEKEYRGSVMKGKQISPFITEVTEIISSASLVPVVNYSKVGLLDEDLFIDGVDHEWCWRGRKLMNLRFFISERASLSHQLGEGDKFFVLRQVAIPTAFRVYYQFRNYFILLRRDYVPIYWKLSNGFKYLIKAIYFPLALNNGQSYFKNIIRGCKDGIRNNYIKKI